MQIKRLIFFGFFCVASLLVSNAGAEQLAVKGYAPAEGLVHERVRAIKRDSRGFLWFGTGDGLSRFDGYAFANYNSAQGLQEPAINDFVERRDGSYWLATNGGAILFNPFLTTNDEKFTLFPIGDESKDSTVQTLYEDRAGRLWAGTRRGLFYLDEAGGQKEFRRVESGAGDAVVNGFVEDAEGSLWMATGGGLIRRSPDGVTVKYEFAAPQTDLTATHLLFDDENRLWVCFIGGLLVVKPEPLAEIKSERHSIRSAPQKTFADKAKLALPEMSGAESWFVAPDGETANLWDLKKLFDGSIWIANRGTGLFGFRDGVLRKYTNEQGLTDNYVNVIEEDSAGNVWVGTETGGAMKINRRGFTAFRDSDGMPRKYVREVFETRTGEIVTITSATEMSFLRNDRFEPLRLSIAPELIVSQTLGRATPFQDHLGEWWIAAKNGLYHYPKLENLEAFAKAKPDRIYTDKNGLPNLNLTAINEDSRGDVWIGTTGGALLTRWERSTNKFYNYSEADGVPAGRVPTGFAETRNGDVWFSFEEGGILRFRAGKFRLFTPADGVPAGVIPTLFADSRGRLWIPSRRGGTARVDDPAADKLEFTTYTPSNGLASINARCVTEDALGRIYIGTVRGVDRLEVENNRIKHYTVADGLSYSEIGTCFRDSKNILWFATYRGLSKFAPEDVESAAPSPTFISGLNVAGVALPVSALGMPAIDDLRFEPAQNQLRIDFFSLGFATGENLRYQYRMEGASDDWSEPNAARTVNFANLGAGDYRFFVRAVDADGKMGDAAAVNFKILPPVYRRWWFLLLAGLLVSAIVLSVERYRAARLRELEDAFGNLSVSENRFRQMNEQSPLGTIIFAPDGSISSVNKAYEDFWGITFEQIKNWDFFADEQIIKSGVADKLRPVFSGETVSLPPTSYDPQTNSAGIKVDENAHIRWIQSFAYPVKNDAGELLEVVLVMEDVTDTKRAAEMEQKAKTDRLRELEQVRKRIAADLHDDIGSSLTQISIFSEVMQQRVDRNDERVLEPLEFIASSSRELVEAMSDIVWAINPQKDFLGELSGKMRRFAADVLTARDIEFTFGAAHLNEELVLGANLRREIFLIFKESVNNIVKHSKCAAVEIEMRVNDSEIFLRLHDDGAGFDVDKITGGHGLFSMKQRAAGLGGTLEIVSGKEIGTTTKLIVPLAANSTDEKK